MKIKFDKLLYSKEALLKAAFAFTHKVYLHLTQDENHYLVEYWPKQDCSEEEFSSLDGEICNELLAQSIRQVVLLQTKNIRELILARSLASTIIDEMASASEAQKKIDMSVADLDNILCNWFEHGK
jgi:His-Xaa-Ser system protein HxsD